LRQFLGGLSRHRPGLLWGGWAAWNLMFLFPMLNGWLLGRGFGALAAGHTGQVLWYALASFACEAGRMSIIHVAAITWRQAWVHMQTLLRANMLAGQMASGGGEAGTPVRSAGEALTHFRDDVDDATMLVDNMVDTTGGILMVALAGLVLGSTNAPAAAVLLLPLLAVGIATRALFGRIKRYRIADREAAEAVGGFVGDIMSAATTIKVNGATDTVLARLRMLVDRRRHTAVRDRVLDTGLMSFGDGIVDIGLGLVVIVTAAAIADGRFGVGQLALFTAYLSWLNFVPRVIGRMMARYRQLSVALGRMAPLAAGGAAANLVAQRSLPIGLGETNQRLPVVRPARVPLVRLDVVGLSATYADGANRSTANSTGNSTASRTVGVHDVSFSLERGSFTVITGPVGSGKTTVLRALLGLAAHANVSGKVLWNGRELDDRAGFLVPPNCAYLPQVPHLISDSVADNIALGPADEATIEYALMLAAVADDIGEMPDGMATMIGPRGLRLSGGQRQRVAAARALVHQPELVVLDDVSSA
ncbi:MAG TPA: ABC transporter ATP-binding protein, partial [Ilumatobacteraceae bacterium]|nr:ABC transporter ATP-binding protein [Ilumatobacteraceae bacterium]